MHRILSDRTRGKIVTRNDVYLSQCTTLANQINALDDEMFLTLKDEVKTLKKEMKTSGFLLEDLAKRKPTFLEYIWLFLGFLPAFFGLMINFIPLFAAKTSAKKIAPSKEFFGSIWMVLSILFTLLYYIILVFLSVMDIIPWFIPLLAVPSGFFAHFYFYQLNRFWIRQPSGIFELKKKSDILFGQYFSFSHV